MKLRIQKRQCAHGLPWWTVTQHGGPLDGFTAWVGSFEGARLITVGEVDRKHIPGAMWLAPGVTPSPRAAALRALQIAEAGRLGPNTYLPIGRTK